MKTFLDGRVTLHGGDCLDVVRGLADNSIDSGVTDPPYALVSVIQRFGKSPRSETTENMANPYGRTGRGFMGKTWDTGETAFAVEFWAEILRVLKPGGHVAAFGGTRSYHRLACAIEDAGFEIRDQLAWCYGTGFPKSHDVSKGIDKAAGAEREVISTKVARVGFDVEKQGGGGWSAGAITVTCPTAPAARQWEGWGTALKPAWEPICLARKPLSERTVAANVLRWGTGAINVDGCLVEGGERPHIERRNDKALDGDVYGSGINGSRSLGSFSLGRFPANLCHDGSDEVLAAFPVTTSGAMKREVEAYGGDGVTGFLRGRSGPSNQHGDSGSAARFFYSSKASKADRALSKHPTVKPVKLMQWLVRLITPPGGVTLDPFAGTGTTGEAAWREGFSAVLIEREEEYQADIERRMLFAKARPKAEPKRKRDCDPGTLELPFDAPVADALPLESEAAYQATMAAE